ncbi:MAG TPA: hypothetical protein VF041_08335 [Gemmatimonadaceae bacterium]
MSAHDTIVPSRPGARRVPATELTSLPCIGGPLNGEHRDASHAHVIWCLASGGPPGRPMVVLLHRSVLGIPRVVETVTASRDALGHYAVDAEGRALRWIEREAVE